MTGNTSFAFRSMKGAAGSALIVLCVMVSLVAVSNPLNGQAAVESRVLALGDAQIEVRMQGSGDVVVVLSGVGAEVSYLDGFGQVLASHDLRVLAINPRAVGRSKGPLHDLTLTDYAADVAGCLDALDVRKATVLGFGGGNRVARRLSAMRPDLVDGLVLVAAGGLVPGDPAAVAQMEIWAEGKAPLPERIAAFRASMLSPATDPESVDQPIVDPVAFQAQMAALNATPLDDWWSGGTAQMLVLQGEDDRIAPVGNGQALEDEFGDRVTVVNIPEAGHLLLVEQAARVAEELLAFVDRPRM